MNSWASYYSCHDIHILIHYVLIYLYVRPTYVHFDRDNQASNMICLLSLWLYTNIIPFTLMLPMYVLTSRHTCVPHTTAILRAILFYLLWHLVILGGLFFNHSYCHQMKAAKKVLLSGKLNNTTITKRIIDYIIINRHVSYIASHCFFSKWNKFGKNGLWVQPL